MVQILEDNSPQTQRMAAFSKLFGNIGQSSQNLKGVWDESQTRSALAQRFGDEFKNIKNPRIQELLASKALDKEREDEKRKAEELSLPDYETVERTFGKNFAELYKAAPVGGKTELLKTGLDAKARGVDLEKMLGGMSAGNATQTNPEQNPSSQEKLPKKKGEVPDYKLNTEGMNSKNIVDFQASLRKENIPIWKETVDQLKDFKALKTDIGILDKINENKNLPEGLEKLLIDPETGAPYPLGTIIKSPHKDVQMWSKTLARQATRAQTAFPGRVTNFDLLSYMRQFPGLFNTYEGRKVILKQMSLVNEANLLISSAMEKVYAKHKLGGITPEDAFSMAHAMVEDDIKEIDQKLLDLADEGEILSSGDNEKPSERVAIYDKNGKEAGTIDISEVDQLPEGYTIK